MSKVILRSFGAFSIFDNLISRKRLVVEQTGPNFGPGGYILNVYRIRLTVKCSQSA